MRRNGMKALKEKGTKARKETEEGMKAGIDRLWKLGRREKGMKARKETEEGMKTGKEKGMKAEKETKKRE